MAFRHAATPNPSFEKYRNVLADPPVEEVPREPGPSFNQVMGAAFRTENVVGSYFAQERFEHGELDPTFDALSEDNIKGYEHYADRFVDVFSIEQSNALKRQIDRETEDRKTIARAGAGGFAAAMVAGTLDPTIFVPVGGTIKKGDSLLKIGYKSAYGALAGATASELLLHSTQETRTAEETAFAMAGATVLGGILGPSVVGGYRAATGKPIGGFDPGDFDVAAKALETEMVYDPQGDLNAPDPVLLGRIEADIASTGVYAPEVVKAQAAALEAMVSTLARRTGQDPSDFYAANGPALRGEDRFGVGSFEPDEVFDDVPMSAKDKVAELKRITEQYEQDLAKLGDIPDLAKLADQSVPEELKARRRELSRKLNDGLTPEEDIELDALNQQISDIRKSRLEEIKAERGEAEVARIESAQRRAKELEQNFQRAKDEVVNGQRPFDTWNGPIPPRPGTLIEWVRAQGGIRDRNGLFEGDLRQMLGGDARNRPGMLNNQTGSGIDELTRKANEEGFDIGPEDYDGFMRAIENELAGEPSFRIGEGDDWRAYQEFRRSQANEVLNQASRAGYGGQDAGEAAEWLAAVRKGLPMDEASRMARAREMGFDTEQTLYHGTDQHFTVFNNSQARRRRAEVPGYFFTDSKEVAAGYGRNVIPAHVRSESPVTLDFGGRSTVFFDGKSRTPSDLVRRVKAISDEYETYNDLPEDLLSELKGIGFDPLYSDKIDGVVLKNIKDNAQMWDDNLASHTVVFDPKNIRRTDATFDPAQSDSPNLLAQSAPRNLFVAHSTSPEKLMKSLELGGMPMPSLAVARTDRGGFNGFGDITFLGDPKLLNERDITAYTADIYSPVVPQALPVIDEGSAGAFVKSAVSHIPEGAKVSPYLNIDSSTRDLPRELQYSDLVKVAFLAEQGRVPKLKKLKVEKEVREASSTKWGSPEREEIAQRYYQRKQDEYNTKREASGREPVNMFFDDETGKVTRRELDAFDREVQKANRSPYDQQAFERELSKRTTGSAAARKRFDEYTLNLADRMTKGQKMFDGYTYSGNPRYKAFTIENIMKQMRKDLRAGEGDGFSGVGQIRARQSARAMKNVKDVQARRDLIHDADEVSKLSDETNDRYFALVEELTPYYRYSSDNRFALLDNIADIIAGGRREWNDAFDAEAIPKIQEFVDHLKGLPTAYFEAKANRVMQPEDFAMAVVPRNLDPKVKAALKERGVKLKFYKSGDQADRLRVIQGQNDLLFQGMPDDVVRGQFDMDANTISLFDNADPSTLMHEASHWYLDRLFKLRGNEFVEKQLSDILEWHGTNADDVFDEAGNLTVYGVELQEAFAETFEIYLQSGKAPVPRLQSVFDQFREWLTALYKALDPRERSDLTPEIKDVFDRMLAFEPEGMERLNLEAMRNPQSVGAAAVAEPELADYELANSLGSADVSAALRLNPLLRLSTADSPVAREIGAQLMENGMYLKRNLDGLASPVSVEQAMTEYRGWHAKAETAAGKAYRALRKDKNTPNMTQREFYERVAFAMRRGDQDTNPHVEAAAKAYREAVEKMKDRAIAEGLLPEDVKVTTADSYFHRMWNRQALKRRPTEFKAMTRAWLGDTFDNMIARANQLRFELEKADAKPNADDKAFLDQVSELEEILGTEGNLNDFAGTVADDIFDALMGHDARLVDTGFSLVPGARGPLKERTFNIPDLFEAQGVRVEDFLVNDAQEVMSRYMRVMAADVELTRHFGGPDMREPIERIREDYRALIDAAQGQNEKKRLTNQMNNRIKDLNGVRDVIRGNYGEDNYDNMFARGAEMVRAWNFMTMLGGMTVSAFPDVGNKVLQNGFMGMFRDMLAPLVTDIKGVKGAAREAKELGIAVELALATRIASIADVGDMYGRGSQFERFVNGLSNRFSHATLMRHWNDVMKSGDYIAATNRAIRVMERPARASKQAKAWLANLGIGESDYQRIMAQYKEHGEKRLTMRLAHVDKWTDDEARRIWIGAMGKNANIQTVTPGAGDKLLVMNGDLGKTIGQFKSFAMAANQRVMIRGMQSARMGDARFVSGLTTFISLGMMVYALKMALSSREPAEDPATWVREGIDRSGILPVFMEVFNTTEKVTGTTLVGESPASRYASRGAFASLLGPSVGRGEDATSFLQGAFDGELKDRDLHALRKLLPFNNIFYVRKLLDEFEIAATEELDLEETSLSERRESVFSE